jgi:hypothetical protein
VISARRGMIQSLISTRTDICRHTCQPCSRWHGRAFVIEEGWKAGFAQCQCLIAKVLLVGICPQDWDVGSDRKRDAIPKATPNPRVVLALSIRTPRARMRGMTHMSQLCHQQRIVSSSHRSTVDVRSVRSCPCTIPNPPRSPPSTHPLLKHHDKSRNPPRSAAAAHEQHHMNHTRNVRPSRCDIRRT